MIDVLKGVKEELEKAACKIRGQEMKARQEVSPQRKPLTKAQALFYKGLMELKGDGSKIRVVYGKLQILFFCVEISQPSIPAKAKVSQRKAGLSTPRCCPRLVQSSATPFLKQW